jgi:hypothetical protein
MAIKMCCFLEIRVQNILICRFILPWAMVDYLKIKIDSKFSQFIVKSFVAKWKIDNNEALYYF